MKHKEKLRALAEKQEPNIQYRYNCFVCNDTKGRLYIKKTGSKILVKCFNDGCRFENGTVLNAEPTYQDTYQKATRQVQDKYQTSQSDVYFKTLPDDYSQTIPKDYKRYLLSLYISDYLIDKYQIGYSNRTDRLVFPTSDGYLARSNHSKPKWLNYTNTFYQSLYRKDLPARIFLVEDPISCIRVGEHAQTIALLGTSCSKNLKQYLRNKDVSVWLDGDVAGIKGALKLKKDLTGVSNSVSIIHTDEDPKKYNDKNIAEIIRCS